jgi:translation initiation factor 2 subunit 3
MEKQPIINIGCLGSVSDGKTTLIEKLTEIKTQRHSSEKIRNITIKQGYGNMKIWKNKITEELITTNSNILNIDDSDLINHISFVDCPGHQDLIHVMLNSISLMNGAIIVIAVDQIFNKKPQLLQHLMAVKISKLKNIIICMNKIDLINKKTLYIRKAELDNLLKDYDIKPYIIIPTCFNKKLGLNYLVSSIMELFNPVNYLNKNLNTPLMRITRSFDINKPGTLWTDITGGVIGGALVQGELHVGDIIEIQPINFKSKIISIKTDEIELDKAISGGLIAILTDIDPYYCKNDALAGNVLGLENTLLSNTDIIQIKDLIIIDNLWKPKINDTVKLQIGSKILDAKLIELYKFELTKPICPVMNEPIIICCMIDKILKIVGNCYLFFTPTDL